MILVTTAGKVGSAATRVLAGAEVVQGDLAVPATLETALRGVSAVVLVSPAVPDQEMNVIAGAVRAGVEHVVKITSKRAACRSAAPPGHR